jgi:RNA polymerase sigma-70 factor (ECF subfamily)
MTPRDQETEALLRAAGQGDAEAREELFRRHRARLERMVAVRLDRRVQARLDASDVVQEILLEANRRWSLFLERRPLPFYPWLRQIGWEVLVKLHEKHLQAQKRRVTREQQGPVLPDQSAMDLMARLSAPDTSLGKRLIRQELRDRVQEALLRLPARDRELLVLRHMEGLTLREIADLLDLKEGTVKVRHFRALTRLQALLAGLEAED